MSKRKSHSFTFEGERYYTKGKTLEEAKKKAEDKIKVLKGEKIIESRRPFDDWWEEYIEVYKSNVIPKTLEVYEMIYRNAIKPHIGNKPLKEIRQLHCQKILNSLDGKSKSYIHKTYILLNSCFEAAVDNELISKNPMRGLRKPEGKEGKRRALTPEERKLFLEAADKCGDAGYYGKIIYFCGLRPSEAMRVHAEDFDLKNRLLSVRGTKTESAVRKVPVPAILPMPEKKKGLLFPSSNGSERGKDGQRNYWLKISVEMEKVSGEPIAEDLTAYCLRHDFGTRCIEAGIDVETVSKMMGHSDVSITSRVYLHESHATLTSAKEKLDKMYG